MRCSRFSTALTLATVLGVVLALGGALQAAPLIYEPFDYNVGDLHGQDGGTGFTGAWVRTKRNPQVTAADNTWGSLVTSGNRVNSNAWSALTRPIGSTLSDAGLMSNGGTLWFSYVMDIFGQNLTNLDYNFALCTDIFEPDVYADRTNLVGGEGIGVSNITAGRIRGAYWQNNDADAIAEKVLADTTLTLDAADNSRALIVGKIQWGATDTDPELLTLYAPGPDLTLSTPILNAWATPALDQSQFGSLSLQFKDSEPSIDEIRFGATAGDVLGVEGVTEPVVIPVPNGEFAMYKPGTGYTVTATFAPGNNYAKGVGDGLTVLGDGTVDYSDGTSGGVVDVPGWVGPVGGTNTNDLWSAGFDGADGTTCLNAFGAWSGQNGNLVESAAALNVPANRAGMTLELSAMVIGDAGARTFDLLVDGVVLTPDSSVDPSYDGGVWQEISRTYTDIPAGDVTILVGTSKPGPGDPALFGSRMRIDNISLTALTAETSAVPEPSTFALAALGLLGLAFYARRRRRLP